jgi:acyl-CoA synthetase (AMP-forming)/AMP-acid ligase II
MFVIAPCSGTTGAPKGVEVTHENIVSGIAALQTYTEHIGIEVRCPPTGSTHCMQVRFSHGNGLGGRPKLLHPARGYSQSSRLMLLHRLQVTPEDSTLSYLPLAHIFDRIVEEFALYSGARIGYYQVILRYLCPGYSPHSEPALCRSVFPCSMRRD